MNDSEVIGAVFVITNDTGRFLLEQRDDNSKKSHWQWVFPGGAREDGEDTLDTVIREAKEEFNIILDKDSCKKIGSTPKKTNDIWSCHIKKTPKPIILSESGGMGWFTLDEIKNMNLGYRQNELILPTVEKYFSDISVK